MLRKNMNASSHEKPNSAGFITAPITDNTAPTAIKTAGSLAPSGQVQRRRQGRVFVGELMIFT